LQIAKFYLSLQANVDITMKIWNKELIDEFTEKHAEAISAFQRWIDIVEDADWNFHAELKKDFPSADYVGNSRYVFNIRGNTYRIVVVVIFIVKILNVRFIGTHTEYNKVNCKTI
jgi:mRNA interferase HigB